jgi:acetoin utilization protein AcuB
MLVGKHMSSPVITISPDTPLQEALNLMRKENVRRFPVVNKRGKLVGIVLEKDLLLASPSSATSLSIWELNYLLSKITVEELMTKEVITVTEDTPIEEAALKMVYNHIGGLPVMRGDELVGVITETDIFKVFIKVLCADQPGTRLVVKVMHTPGQLALLTKAIYEKGGNILALVAEPGEGGETYDLTMKINGISAEDIGPTIKDYVIQVLDIRSS